VSTRDFIKNLKH